MGRAKVDTENAAKVKSLLQFGLSQSEVAQFIQKKLSGGEKLSNRPGQGHPRKTNEAQDKALVLISK